MGKAEPYLFFEEKYRNGHGGESRVLEYKLTIRRIGLATRPVGKAEGGIGLATPPLGKAKGGIGLATSLLGKARGGIGLVTPLLGKAKGGIGLATPPLGKAKGGISLPIPQIGLKTFISPLFSPPGLRPSRKSRKFIDF